MNDLCQCVFREDGKETPFTWPYERLQELMDRCARKFTDGRDIGGPDLRRDDAKRRPAKR